MAKQEANEDLLDVKEEVHATFIKRGILYTPTLGGNGRTAINLKKGIESVSYKEVKHKKTRPNGEKYGKEMTQTLLLVTTKGQPYSVSCIDLDHGSYLFDKIVKYI